MADVWLSIKEVGILLPNKNGGFGIAKPNVLKAIKAGKFTVREVPGNKGGGKGGVRYEVLLSSLPEKAQEKYRQNQEAEFEAKVKAHLGGVSDTPAETPTPTPGLPPRKLSPSEGGELKALSSSGKGEPGTALAVIGEAPETLPALRRDGSGYLKEKRLLPPSEHRDKDRAEGWAKVALVRAMRNLGGELGLSDTRAAAQLVLALAEKTASDELQSVAERAGRGDGSISARSLLRWAALYDKGVMGNDAVKYLAPARRMKDEWQVAPWAAAVLARYRLPQKPTLALAVRQAVKDLKAAGWPDEQIPGYDSVRHWLERVPLRTRMRNRMSGSDLKALLPHKHRDWSWMASNDVWVGDGHSFKAKVRHPIHGQAFAPEVTVILDCASRFVVGFAISLAENCVAVGEALGKGMVTHGLPLIYYSDNGAGQTGKHLDMDVVGIFDRHGIYHATGWPGNPQGRGIIERLWQTTTIPQAKGYKSYQGKDMDKLALKRVTAEIEKAARKGIVPDWLTPWDQFFEDCKASFNAYNWEHEHDTLGGKTPGEAYMEKLNADAVWVLTEAEAADVFRPEVMRTVQRGEVTLFRNVYGHKALEEWGGKQVRVLYDLADANQVWVRDIDGRALCTAKWNANMTDGFAKPVIEQLADKRVENGIKALRKKEAVLKLEQTRILEGEYWHEQNSALVLDGQAIIDAEGEMTPAKQRQLAAEQAYAKEMEEAERVIAEHEAEKNPSPLPSPEEEREQESPASTSSGQASTGSGRTEAPAETAKILPMKPRQKTLPEMDELETLEYLAEHPELIDDGYRQWMEDLVEGSKMFAAEYRRLFGNKRAAG